jgi:large subunit ribosomal protein L30
MAQLEIKQVKSRIGQCKRQKATLDALGLRKMNAVVVHDSNLVIKGMVEKVKHLVEVKEI